MSRPTEFSNLFRNYINGTASAEEQQTFLVLADQEAVQEELVRLVDDEMQNGKQPHSLDATEKQEILTHIYQISGAAEMKQKPVPVYSLWKKVAVAAAVLCVVGAGMFFYAQHSAKQQQLAYLNEMKPGKNAGTLTLGDGRKISLAGAANGKLADEVGVSITKSDEGEIIYTAGVKGGKGVTNTLSTANGQQFRLVLPDGTNVWLNAASSIKYPTTFVKLSTRQVVLTGEAYFEVTKDKTQPFVVKTGRQEVEVLGTHFNINSYTNEEATRTTLLEGSVKVTPLDNNGLKDIEKQSLLLKPDYQAELTENGLTAIKVDAEAVIDWKSGKFIFDNESLHSIMNKVSRWYNVEVQYQNEGLKNVTFTGTLSRYDDVNKVLSKLELTKEVEFKVSGRKIIVIPK